MSNKTDPRDIAIKLDREKLRKLRSSAPQWRNKPLRSDDYMKPMLAKSTEPPELDEETLTALSPDFFEQQLDLVIRQRDSGENESL